MSNIHRPYDLLPIYVINMMKINYINHSQKILLDVPIYDGTK